MLPSRTRATRLMRRGLLCAVLLPATGCDRSSVPTDSASTPAAPATMTSASDVPASRGGGDLVGTPALPFAPDLTWLNSPPLRVEELRGKVVLVRFWTDTCPFCEASAPGLSRLHERYGPEGLVVVGMFHPKPRGSARNLDAIESRAKTLGMHFPIASDSRWDTLERWWLASGDRAATSVSFLIDARGVIRWIHPGPEFHPDGPADHQQCRDDYNDAVRAIEALLAERDRRDEKVG